MKIDTGSRSLWVFDKDCKINCENENKYDSTKSTDSKVKDRLFEKVYGNSEVTGNTVEDTMYLTPNIEIKAQRFGAVTKTNKKRKGYDGIIGIT